MVKVLSIFTLCLLFSCQNNDCANGQQDGNETGVDCGGDCVSCNTGSNLNPTESILIGSWTRYEEGQDVGGNISWSTSPYYNSQIWTYTSNEYTLNNPPTNARIYYVGTPQDLTPQSGMDFYLVNEDSMTIQHGFVGMTEIISISSDTLVVLNFGNQYSKFVRY